MLHGCVSYFKIAKAGDVATKRLGKWFKIRDGILAFCEGCVEDRKCPLTCAVLRLDGGGIMVPVVRPTPVRAAL